MARPTTIEDSVLLGAARELFFAKGMAATTSEIAERAGVSEGILFHRFGSKAALFTAATTPPDVDSFIDEVDWTGYVGKSTVEENLVALGGRMVEFFRQLMPCMMMRWSNRAEFHGVFPSKSMPPPLQILRRLTGYFEGEIDRGRLRAIDPEIVARAFLGGVMQHVMGEILTPQAGGVPLPRAMYLRGLADLLLHGATPTPAVPKVERASRAPRSPRRTR